MTRIVTLLSLVALALVASANVAPPALATPRVQAQKAQLSAKAAQNLAPLSEDPAKCGDGDPCNPPLRPGSPVQQHPVVYLIFWGSKWNTDTNTPQGTIYQALHDTFANLAGTEYNDILSQYYSDPNNQDSYVHNDVRIGGEWIDTQNDPTAPINRANILAEAQRATGTQGWLPTPDSQFMVFPQVGTGLLFPASQCGEHDASDPYVYSYVDTTGTNPSCTSKSDPLGVSPQATTTFATHEYAEAATDPNGGAAGLDNGTGWTSIDGNLGEIGDLCVYGPSTINPKNINTPSGNDTLYVTTLWSNADNSCDIALGTEYQSPVAPMRHTVKGAINDAYVRLGGIAGFLGEPTTEEYSPPGAHGTIASPQRESDFQFGRIYYSAASGAHEVHAGILNEFLADGGPTSGLNLGFPTTDETETTKVAGRVSYFNGQQCNGGGPNGSGSAIFWTSPTGTHEVHGCIYQAYERIGGPASVLGFPTTDEFGVAFGRQSNFQHGSITWNGSLASINVNLLPTATTTAADGLGRLETVALGSDKDIWHNSEPCATCGWTGWSRLQLNQQFNGDPVLGQNANGRLQVFARASNNAIWTNWQDGATGNWVGWQVLSQSFGFQGTPSVTRNSSGELEIFAHGGDGNIWHNWETCLGCGWNGWVPLQVVQGGLQFNGDPVVAQNANGFLQVFARGSNNAIWTNWQQTNGAWNGWVVLSQSFGFQGTPSVTRNSSGELEIFAHGGDGNIWHNWETCIGCGWSGWFTLQGGGLRFNSDAVVGQDTDGRLEVFALDLGNAVRINFQNAAGAWQGWSTLSQSFAFEGTPAVARNANGELEVMAHGSDANIWHNAQTCAGCGWTGWSRLQNSTLAFLP